MVKLSLTEKEREILVNTLEKQLILLTGNNLETAKTLLIYLRRV